MEAQQFKIEILPLREDLLLYAGKILKNQDDAEDVVQEVLLKLWILRNELKNYRSLKAFSIEITKNVCLNRLKKEKIRDQDLGNLMFNIDELTPYEKLEHKDSLEKIMNIMEKLPDMQQSVLRMKHIEGMEIHEIADLIGSNPEAIRMNLSRARKKIRDIFLKL